MMRGLLLFCLLILMGCTANGENAGTLVVWHILDDEAEQAALDRVVTRFVDIYEDAEIILQYVERDELLDRYRTAAEMGLGPNLMLGQSDWVQSLARDGLIADLTSLEPRTDIYYTRALASLRDETGLYGLPFALHLQALYYNRDLVDQPPQTLDDLLNAAEMGQSVGINTHFDEVFWGVQAFGGELFDDTGRVVLDEGSFANWLSWLSDAQTASGMFLERDLTTLIDLFTSSRIAYLVGGPDILPQLRTELGAERIGVATLPDGPGGVAGPLLEVDAWMINPASSGAQTQLALLLASFVSNTEQASLLMREAQIVPANRRVRVDERIYPAVHGFREQVQTALPLPNLPQLLRVRELGDDLMVRVLEGLVTPSEVAQEITTTVNREFGYAPEVAQVEACTLSGSLVVWHDLTGNVENLMEAIAESYEQQCPEVEVSMVYRADTDEFPLIDQYREEVTAAPDLILGRDDWAFPLAVEGLIQPVDDDLLQQYRVRAVESLTIGGEVYGLPLSLYLPGLYYDPAQVGDEVATSTEELRNQLENGVGIAMPVTFEDDYWGFSAFGGTLTDPSGAFVFDQEAWLAWLTWLETISEYDNVFLAGDDDTLRPRFDRGQVAYYVGEPQASQTFTEFAVTTLPGVPVLTVESFFINGRLDEDQAALAQDFAVFATGEPQQQVWLERAGRLPANVNVIIPDDSPLRPFVEQIPDAVALPQIAAVDVLQENAGRIMRSVVRGRRTAEEGVIALGALFGIAVDLPDATDILPDLVPTEATPEVDD